MSEATQAVEPVLDAASEAILEGVDGVVDTIEVVRNNPIAIVAVGVVSLAVGAAGGYFFAVRKLGKEFDARIEQEIEDTKEYYARLNKVGPDGAIMSPMEVLEKSDPEAAAALRKYQGDDPDGFPEGEPYDDIRDEEQIQKIEKARLQTITTDAEGGQVVEVEVSSNVFADSGFDLVAETANRSSDKPYVISHDEYFAAEQDYDNITLTYFEVDGVLVDEQDIPLDDKDESIGEDAITRFGHGSKDKNVVYVRNDRLGIDYEVVRSNGSYLEEVLGMPNEEPGTLRHSDQRDRRRAFRHGDG